MDLKRGVDLAVNAIASRSYAPSSPSNAALGVEAVGVSVIFKDLADHDGAVLAGIDGDLTRRPCYRLFDNLDAVFFVFVRGLDPRE